MFGEKCIKCDKRVSRKYEFCPHCGVNLDSGEYQKGEGDYGFLGRGDFGVKLPMGLNALMKPLMKELTKQMRVLDEEFKREQDGVKKNPGNSPRPNMGNFSIHIGVPGAKPIRMGSSNSSQLVQQNSPSGLPKIDSKKLEKTKDFPRKEPKTSIRRLSDKVTYNVELPGVDSLSDVNMVRLEDSLEIKAIAKDCLFFKVLEVALPLKSYSFKDEKLILNLGLK